MLDSRFVYKRCISDIGIKYEFDEQKFVFVYPDSYNDHFE